MNIRVLFGERIKILRKKRNMTQSQIAELIDVDPKHISCIENGKNFPSPELLSKLANVFNIKINELFEFETHPTIQELKIDLIKTIDTASAEELVKIYNYSKFITG